MNLNVNYDEILKVLTQINPVNQDEENALSIARALCQKEIPVKVEVDTHEMDEFCNDYYYVCPICGSTIFSENEFVGRCDCGQVIKCPRFEDWGEQFQKEHVWNPHVRKWQVKKRKGAKRCRT